MNHLATPQFWQCHQRLPAEVRQLADKSFLLLKADPQHPSLHFKKIEGLRSVRVGRRYRALGLDKPGGVIWLWIGPHDEYERLLR